MSERYKIYLDVCCLNRPFDDWQQDRVRFEGEAVLTILERVQAESWQIVSSEVIEAELERLPNPDKLASILNLLSLATQNIVLDNATTQRAQVFAKLGFGVYDAFHLACAEQAQVDIFLTTDDRLIKRAIRYRKDIQVPLSNPVNWLMTVLPAEGELK